MLPSVIEVRDAVVAVVAQIAGRAPTDVRSEQRLSKDLGLDTSLQPGLVVDLRQYVARWTSVSAITTTSVESAQTVADLIAVVIAAIGSSGLRKCPAGHATADNPCRVHGTPTKGWTD